MSSPGPQHLSSRVSFCLPGAERCACARIKDKSMKLNPRSYGNGIIQAIEEKYEAGPIIVTIMEKDKLKVYHQIVNDLRNAGIKSELYLGNPKDLGLQLKYADKIRRIYNLIKG